MSGPNRTAGASVRPQTITNESGDPKDRSPRKRSRPRSKTTTRRQLWRERARTPSLAIVAEDVPERPATRGECPTTRPCPWVGCRYHLYLDVHPRVGSIQFNAPDLEPWEMAETCALDVADRVADRAQIDENGRPATLDEVGAVMNISRERVRQIEVQALASLRRYGRLR